jgi:hypothetical protein
MNFCNSTGSNSLATLAPEAHPPSPADVFATVSVVAGIADAAAVSLCEEDTGESDITGDCAPALASGQRTCIPVEKTTGSVSGLILNSF